MVGGCPILFGINPGIILAIAIAWSVILFLGIWSLLNYSHTRILNKWSFVNNLIEKVRRKGESPVIKKYGLIGLAVLLAIPVPTIGVYGAASLTWMAGVNRWRALLAVVSGVVVSNSLILFSLVGIVRVIPFLR